MVGVSWSAGCRMIAKSYLYIHLYRCIIPYIIYKINDLLMCIALIKILWHFSVIFYIFYFSLPFLMLQISCKFIPVSFLLISNKCKFNYRLNKRVQILKNLFNFMGFAILFEDFAKLIQSKSKKRHWWVGSQFLVVALSIPASPCEAQ